jgi:hypothetical protein
MAACSFGEEIARPGSLSPNSYRDTLADKTKNQCHFFTFYRLAFSHFYRTHTTSMELEGPQPSNFGLQIKKNERVKIV